jgi:hypothetical protein
MTDNTAVVPKILQIFQKLAVDNAVCDMILPFEQLSFPLPFRYNNNNNNNNNNPHK